MHFSNSINFLTAEHVKHVNDEEVVESDLALGDGARRAIELRHHHGEAKTFLIVSLDYKSLNGNIERLRDFKVLPA